MCKNFIKRIKYLANEVNLSKYVTLFVSNVMSVCRIKCAQKNFEDLIAFMKNAHKDHKVFKR